MDITSEYFELLWWHSVCLGLSQPAADATAELNDDEVVRALRSGQTDDVAARELGLSVRTYRRRVSELMRTLGARSRFEAGYLARGARRGRRK